MHISLYCLFLQWKQPSVGENTRSKECLRLLKVQEMSWIFWHTHGHMFGVEEDL